MVDRFVAAQTSETDAINVLADELHNQVAVATVKSGATTAWTAAEMLSGLIRQTGAHGALGITTATAAALVALMKNVQVGSQFTFAYQNVDDNTSTLTGGTGVTLVGTTAVPTNKTQLFRGVVTNKTAGAEAVSLYGLLYAPV